MLLIVTAHPIKTSITHSIANALVASDSETNHIDLYTKEWQQSFYTRGEIESVQDAGISRKSRDLITKADHIVILHPVWWGGSPAVLKNWIDWTLEPGFAYQHSYPKWLPRRLRLQPKQLLKDKKLTVITTGDGFKFLFQIVGMPFFKTWNIYIKSYVGFQTKTKYIGGIRYRSKDNIAKTVDKMVDMVLKR